MPVTAIRFDVTSPYELLCCFKCGIQFAVPLYYLEQKLTGDNDVLCPNGHDLTLKRGEADGDDDLRDENARLRRELLLEKHNAEQAEARLRDSRPPEPRVEATAKKSRVLTVEELHRTRHDDGTFKCPHCPRHYRYTGSLRRHLIKAHDDREGARRLDEAAAGIILNAERDAEGGAPGAGETT